MKKLLLLMALTLMSSASLIGQTEKGNLLIGGNGGLNLHKPDGQEKMNFNMSLSPKIGLFLIDNLAIGAQVLGAVRKTGGQEGVNSTLYIGPFARYYLHNLFLEANFGLNRGDFDAGLGLGYAFFVTPNVAIEPIAQANLLNGFDLNVLVGFQLYFSPGELRGAF